MSTPHEPGIPSNVLEVLRTACKRPKTRAAVVRDPRAYLDQHGIHLAENEEIILYERARPPRKGRRGVPDPASPVLSQSTAQATRGQALPVWYEEFWKATHGGCPPGTAPYTTTRFVRICDVWAMHCIGKDWVQDVEGTALGHWECTAMFPVCIVSHYEGVVVTECLPMITHLDEVAPT
jgi:hypothetical protein